MDISEIHPKRCHPDEFVRMALLVLGDKPEYVDDLIEIRKVGYGWNARKELEITRRPITNLQGTDQFLSCDNPVTMVYEEKVIRHHGEHIYLTEHLEKLVDALGS